MKRSLFLRFVDVGMEFDCTGPFERRFAQSLVCAQVSESDQEGQTDTSNTEQECQCIEVELKVVRSRFSSKPRD
jgi:hypothetical protein